MLTSLYVNTLPRLHLSKTSNYTPQKHYYISPLSPAVFCLSTLWPSQALHDPHPPSVTESLSSSFPSSSSLLSKSPISIKPLLSPSRLLCQRTRLNSKNISPLCLSENQSTLYHLIYTHILYGVWEKGTPIHGRCLAWFCIRRGSLWIFLPWIYSC
jgi:hypothetical protein